MELIIFGIMEKIIRNPLNLVAIDDVRLFGTKNNEDCSNITTDVILNLVKDRLISCYFFPSIYHEEDRMVLHLKSYS